MHDLIFSAAADPAAPAIPAAVALPVAGVLTAATALVLMVKRKTWRRIQAVLMFVTGLALAGTAGALRDWLESWWTRAGSTVTDKVFGTAVPYAFALVLVIWFALDMDLDGLAGKIRKKPGSGKHTTTVLTPWLALLVPVALASVPFLAGAPAAIQAMLR